VTVFEELLHVLPQLQHLTVVMVGPELSETHMPDANTCDKCEKVGKKMTLLSYPMLYEEYVSNAGTKNNNNTNTEDQPSEANEFKRPDLVCAFNSGIHEAELMNKENSWQPALEWILQNNVPLLVTSYNAEEAEMDQKYIEKLGGKVELSHQLNPFRSLHPNREPTTTNQFYFLNYYLHLVRGKK
jgi:splicing suppressor protein 51